MDALFIATPSEVEVATALKLWPELAGRQVRPLLVTAFGDIFLETREGEILLVDTLELACSSVASSVAEFRSLVSDPDWTAENLFTEIVLLASECGITRSATQVF